MLPYSKVIELEDFEDPELIVAMREACAHKLPHLPAAYPRGAEHRKDWEVAMAVRALDHFGALRPDALVLGVAAGSEDTIFYLTKRVRQVFATDRYLVPGAWASLAPPVMLAEPAAFAPCPFDEQRLVVQHMDGRSLRYPADTFDGIFSSGSIEHFGELQDSAYAAYEMGRVLKPGGILSLSTEFKLSGPAGGIGWPGMTLVFSPEHLQRYIVEASGLELVDSLRTEVSESTLARPWDLPTLLADRAAALDAHRDQPDFSLWEFPHIVLVQEGYAFTSVHLTLRKPAGYPVTPNAWAKPPPRVLAEISEYNRQTVASLAASPPAQPAAEDAASAPVSAVAAATAAGPGAPEATRDGAPERLLARVDATLRSIDRAREETDRGLRDLSRLAEAAERRTAEPDMTSPEPEASSWVLRDVVLPGGRQLRAVIEDAADAAWEWESMAEANALRLMLDLIQPGDRVLDLGAQGGMFSLAAAAAGCLVLAVEASATKAALLRSALWRNGFHGLTVVNAVAAGAVSMGAVTAAELTVEMGWPSVSLIRIGQQSTGPEVLEGLERLLDGTEAPPVIFTSDAQALAKAGSGPGTLLAKLAAFGYATYLIDRGRLTRSGAADVQPAMVATWVGLKRRPAGLDGWIVVPTMTDDDRAARLVAESQHDNPDHRRHVARTLAACELRFVTRPDVAAVLDALRRDAVDDVRNAAAWSISDVAADQAGVLP